jgi:hypothetical protein
MRVKNKEFAVTASVKLKFIDIIHNKKAMGRTAVIGRYDAFFMAKDIIVEIHTLPFQAIPA